MVPLFSYKWTETNHQYRGSSLLHLVEPRGIDEIKVWLRRAVASGAHPRRISLVRFPIFNLIKIKIHPAGWTFILVEVRGIEPLSESNLEGTSPGAVCYLHSLILTGTNTLQDLVAS